MSARFAYFWEFKVHENSVDRFVALYGPSGEWVRLFRQAEGYIRTDFFRDVNKPERFVTVDHWESESDYKEFRKDFASEFDEIDRLGENLTDSERFLGDFNLVSS